MHKIYPTLIFALLVILSSVLVNSCSSCNDSKKSQPSTHNFNEQPAGENGQGNKKYVKLPPAKGQQPPPIPNKSLNKEEGVRNQAINKEIEAKIKQEIIETEESYNKSIKIFKDFYLTPLLKEDIFKKDKKIQKFTQELQQVFNPLITISNSLQEDLKAKSNPEITNQELGVIFNRHVPFLSYFKSFVDSYNNMLMQYNKLAKGNKKFKNFLKDQKTKPELNQLDFQDYFIMPIQRIPRHKLLLEKLLENMPTDDPGYKSIKEAVERTSQALNCINVGAHPSG